MGLGRSGAVGQGRGLATQPRRCRPGPGGAVRGQAWPRQRRSGPGVAGAAAAARVEVMCEREKREKERVGPDTIPTYVRQADTSADEHKRAGLPGGRGALCSSATQRT
jgi:hypothetical protein